MAKQTTADFKLKFTARVVDKIERKHNVSVENLLGDTAVARLAFFIEKGYWNEENDTIGTDGDHSFKLLDAYLAENDKEELLMFIMEALQVGGFLSRKINIDQMRLKINKEVEEAQTTDDSANSGKA